MTGDAIFEAFVRDAEHTFAGWDFSYINDTGRWATEPLPWSYASLVLPHLRAAGAMLDMGTGGGEFLSRLQPLPAMTVATEGYAPNVPIARDRLTPLGVQVIAIDQDTSHTLPLADATFDLTINRHEYYDPHEVRRILKPGGRFITQQVGGGEYPPLRVLLGDATPNEYAHWTREYAVHELLNAGLTVTASAEAFPMARCYDVGALIYYLFAIPWDVPDFSVERHRDALFAVHQRIQHDGYIAVEGHRFIIQAQRDESS
jgi:SAM-dependent methyltransferase